MRECMRQARGQSGSSVTEAERDAFDGVVRASAVSCGHQAFGIGVHIYEHEAWIHTP